MKARYIQRGDSVDFTPTTDVAAGDVIHIGVLTGVAKLDIKAGELGALALTGVYELAVKTGKAFSAGQAAYFDPSDGTVTPDAPTGSGGAFLFGHTLAVAATGAATVPVRLAQGA